MWFETTELLIKYNTAPHWAAGDPRRELVATPCHERPSWTTLLIRWWRRRSGWRSQWRLRHVP
ncbi:MAG: hypothetical protein AAFV53_04645 [Myxococcota bacterium]